MVASAAIEGELVALGPLRHDLLPIYQRRHNDVATLRTYVIPLPTTLEQEAALYEALTAHPRLVIFTIYERASGQPIGTTYLTDIDHQQRSAEFGVLIGETPCRGKGYGTEVTRTMLTYAFAVLGLHSVMLTVYAYNRAGRRADEKAGFREAARRRQRIWLNGPSSG